MNAIKIKVKQDHINRGDPCSSDSCPIALAVIEATGAKPDSVSVGYSGISIFSEDGNVRKAYCKTPQIARTFIRLFDDYEKVSPFEFEADFS